MNISQINKLLLSNKLTLGEETTLLKIRKVISSGSKLHWKQDNFLTTIQNKYGDIYKSSKRSELYRQIAYQRRAAKNHYDKLNSIQKELYVGNSQRNSYVTKKPEWLDWNVKNKLQFLTDEELEDLLKEITSYKLEVNSPIKRIRMFVENSTKILIESLRQRYISETAFVMELRIIWRNSVLVGFGKNDIKDMINRILEEEGMSSHLYL